MMRQVVGSLAAVVVTPAAARRDSRALKQGASLARAGFRSIIFEGLRSDAPVVLSDVLFVGMDAARSKTSSNAQESDDNLLVRFRKRVTSPNASWIESWVGFLTYLVYYMRHFVVGGLRNIPPASLYYVSEFSFFPAVWLKSWWHGAVIAYDARDFYVGIETHANKTRFQRLVVGFGRMIEARCIRTAQVFTTVGEGIASLFEAEYGRRPETVYNAHDARIDLLPKQGLRERFQLPPDATIVVIVGQAKPGQTFSGILGALDHLPSVHVALVGNGYRQMLATVSKASGVQSRIHYVEDVPANEVVPLIGEADASLLVYYQRSANYKNALPNGFFQSVAAGLPVLHGGLSEMSRVCSKFDFGVAVAPDDAAALTDILGQVVQKSEWYRDQKERSMQAARELTWKNQEPRLQSLLVTAVTRVNSKG